MAAFAAGDLVDLVEADDARLLHALDRDARDLVHIDQPLLFFLDQILEGLADLHLLLLGALAEDVGQHVLNVDVHFLDALISDDLESRCRPLADIELHDTLVELALAQLLAEFLARTRTGLASEDRLTVDVEADLRLIARG